LQGDHLVSIAGYTIDNVSDVPGAVFFTRANQFTTIEVLRGEELMEFSVKTLPRPEASPVIQHASASTTEQSIESTVERVSAVAP